MLLASAAANLRSIATPSERARCSDDLSGTMWSDGLDRWIYVLTGASFIGIMLAGFVPSSLAKIAAVQAGDRQPFPLVVHLHAALMGAFLLLLLAQTSLAAIGKRHLHRQLGLIAVALVPALVIVGFILVPTTYHDLWNAAQAAPADMKPRLHQVVLRIDNIMLLQLRIGVLFPLFLMIGLRAAGNNPGLHKRMMILATAVAVPAGIERIPGIPTTMPASPATTDLYTLLVISPMLLRDIIRSRSVHKAYWIWLGISLPFTAAVHALWDTQSWHSVAPRLMGV